MKLLDSRSALSRSIAVPFKKVLGCQPTFVLEMSKKSIFFQPATKTKSENVERYVKIESTHEDEITGWRVKWGITSWECLNIMKDDGQGQMQIQGRNRGKYRTNAKTK